MKHFTHIKENNEIINTLSNRHIKFKEYILDNLDYDNKEDLINILTINKESLSIDGKNTIKSLQTIEDKMTFSINNHEILSSVLNDTDWFFTQPNQLGIDNVSVWLSKAVDTALLNVINIMLSEL